MCKEVLEDCSHAFSLRAVDTNVRKKVKIIQHAYPSTSMLYLRPASYYEMRAVIPLKETMKFKQSS